jgi:hypothetical protein
MTHWKRGELFTQRKWATSQKILTFRNAAVRTSHLTHCALLYCQHECVLQDGCSINGKSEHRFMMFSLVTMRSHSQLQHCTNSTAWNLPLVHSNFLYISYHVQTYCTQNFNRSVRENTPSHPSWFQCRLLYWGHRKKPHWLTPSIFPSPVYFPVYLSSCLAILFRQILVVTAPASKIADTEPPQTLRQLEDPWCKK